MIIIFAAVAYSPYLTTKVAPGARFKILTPKNLTAGKNVTILWDTSPESMKKFPFQQIEYCSGTSVTHDCAVIAAKVPNAGKTVVELPAALPAGEGYFKFTAWDEEGVLAASSITSNSVFVSSNTN